MPHGTVCRTAARGVYLFINMWYVLMMIDKNIPEIATIIRAQAAEKQADMLYFALYEMGLTDSERQQLIDILQETDEIRSETSVKLTEGFVKLFANYRQNGLSLEDTARIMGISPLKMRKILRGEGVDNPVLHRQLIAAEIGAEARLKNDCLSTVMSDIREGNGALALKFLERRFPAEFKTPEKGSTQPIEVKISSHDSETRALDAAARLAAIREERDADI